MHWSSICMTRTHMSRVCPVFFSASKSFICSCDQVDRAFGVLSPSIIASLDVRPKVKSN